MAKSVLVGQMKTKITIKKLTAGMDSEGYQTETWENIFKTRFGVNGSIPMGQRFSTICEWNWGKW